MYRTLFCEVVFFLHSVTNSLENGNLDRREDGFDLLFTCDCGIGRSPFRSSAAGVDLFNRFKVAWD
jgi:single-stranded DNA-specific DHH superfamily exonuclease